MSLFDRKPIAAANNGEHGMRRTLGAGDLVMLAIGAVIGAGIFSSLGTAAAGETLADGTVVRYGAGPALVLSFILLGAVCGLAALCYAELASMIPQAGSAYAYSMPHWARSSPGSWGGRSFTGMRSATWPWPSGGVDTSHRCFRASGSICPLAHAWLLECESQQ